MEHIDAIDNGIPVAEGNLRYFVTTTLGNRVGRLNPSWHVEPSKRDENGRFKKAMELTGSEFLEVLRDFLDSWLPARAIVEDAMNTSLYLDNQVLKLENYCPWRSHLQDAEKDRQLTGSIKYVLFPDTNGTWRIQAMPLEGSEFLNRLPLPADWCGLRDKALSEKAGIEGCVFVHASGFIGGNVTYDGAFQMAMKSLSLQQTSKIST